MARSVGQLFRLSGGQAVKREILGEESSDDEEGDGGEGSGEDSSDEEGPPGGAPPGDGAGFGGASGIKDMTDTDLINLRCRAPPPPCRAAPSGPLWCGAHPAMRVHLVKSFLQPVLSAGTLPALVYGAVVSTRRGKRLPRAAFLEAAAHSSDGVVAAIGPGTLSGGLQHGGTRARLNIQHPPA